MTETSIQLIAAFGLFVLGIAIGVLLQRTTKGDGKKIARLQQKLTETEDRFTRYQADVTAHFMDTAKKVQTLNRSYKDVHDQLTTGARKLCESVDAEEFLPLNFERQSDANHRGHTIDIDDSGIAPPMDYAPKEPNKDEGTLSENFGLDETKLKEFDENLEKEYKGESEKG